MSYHDLSSCTLNAEERREEANRILNMIGHLSENMTVKEQDFCEDIMDENDTVSVKQLFWLRDIKDKYL